MLQTRLSAFLVFSQTLEETDVYHIYHIEFCISYDLCAKENIYMHICIYREFSFREGY